LVWIRACLKAQPVVKAIALFVISSIFSAKTFIVSIGIFISTTYLQGPNMQNISNMTIEQIQALASVNAGTTATKKESNFDTYTLWFPDSEGNDTYLGNYSMPLDFTEVTKANIKGLFATKGIRLQAPGVSQRKDVTFG
jgi:hypothetical protein